METTIENAIERFLQDVIARGLSRATWRRYHDDLLMMAGFLKDQGRCALDTVTADDLRAYLAHLISQPNSRHSGRTLSLFTVEGRYRSAKAFFNWCTTDELIKRNPMLHVRRPKLPKRLVARLSEDQVQRLLDLVEQTQSPQRNMALILLLVGSGLRRGEVLGLRVSDVDFREGKVTVIGKGNKQREVPFGAATERALRLWFLARPPSDGDRVFINADGTPFEADGVRSIFLRLGRKLGVPRLYPHLLRHTFAKLYLKRADAKSLQQILGHAKASTTLDLYVHFEFDDLRQIYNRASPIDALAARSPRMALGTRTQVASAPGDEAYTVRGTNGVGKSNADAELPRALNEWKP